jgi:Fe-S cluster assembly ATP-binding protein
MAAPELVIDNLHVSVDGTPVLKGLSLTVRGGEVHAVMGPNGTGKSTLAQTLMGHPRYVVTGGRVTLDGQDVLALKTHQRSRLGLFLAMQYPYEVSGVTTANFLRTALNSRRPETEPIRLKDFRDELDRAMDVLHIDHSFANRYLNEGFSGGEKKRNEILQMMLLQPRIAILDEIDSGLDIDAVRIVSEGVEAMRAPELGMLLITHYQRILNYVTPDIVHIMFDGRVVRSGGPELAAELEQRGYEWIREEV